MRTYVIPVPPRILNMQDQRGSVPNYARWGASTDFGLTISKTTFPEFVLPVGLRYEESGRCCDYGVVNVQFRLDRGRIVVTKATFDPDAGADPW
jgi:hypothetical protein